MEAMMADPTSKELIFEDRWAALQVADRQVHFKQIAQRIFETCPGWMTPIDPRAYNFQTFAEYLIDLKQPVPGFIEGLDPQAKIKVSFYRHFFARTLPLVTSKKQGLDFGLSESDEKLAGLVVVPKRNGRESKATKFGQEMELTLYHFMVYAYQMIPLEAFKKVYDHMITHVTDSGAEGEAYRRFLEEFQENGEYLSADKIHLQLSPQEQAPRRLELLRLVMQGGSAKIKICPEQLVRNVQDTVGSQLVAGASGTVNPFPLLTQFKSEDAVSVKSPQRRC
jgi:hypothetical protein